MYFSKQEVDLIRAAAAAMPLGGARDPGKAQLSSLTDHAADETIHALLLEIDVRERGRKLNRQAAQALRTLMEAISLCDEEIRHLPEPRDERQRDRALRHKRAMALRYVNKLRVPPSGRRRSHSDAGGRRHQS